MRPRVAVVLLLLIVVVLASVPAGAASPKTRRLSVRNNGTEGNDESDGYIDDLSNDGRVAVFSSDADNLVPNDENSAEDIFVHDMTLDKTMRVSVSSSGEEADEPSSGPSISGNGRYVAFTSEATNLVDNDTNGVADIFRYDLLTGKTRRASLKSNNAEGILAAGDQPDFSRNGRFVVFYTSAQLVGKDENDDADIYLRDMKQRRTMLISKRRNGNAVNDGASFYPTISEDGRLIAYQSTSSELVRNDSNDTTDIFFFNLDTDNTRRISVRNNGSEIMLHSEYPSMSGDGQLVAFDSAGKLTSADKNAQTDIYLWNRNTGEVRLITKDKNGNALNMGANYASISPNGRMIGFYSYSTDVINNDPPGNFSAYAYDRKREKTILVDRKTSGEAGNGESYVIGISRDGRFVLIGTDSALAGNDLNTTYDVYRRGPLY